MENREKEDRWNGGLTFSENFIPFSTMALSLPSLQASIPVLKKGRTFRRDIFRWDRKHYPVPGPRTLVSLDRAAWFSPRNDTDGVIREWWEPG